MAFGGGIDVKLIDHILLRADQADYLFTKHDFSGRVKGIATHQNNLRASVGIVFQFGSHARKSNTANSTQTLLHMRQHQFLLWAFLSHQAMPGVQITEVTQNGVAAVAGLHPDDIINTVNGAPIKTPTELAAAMSGIAPGSTVRLGVIVRGLWQTETSVILGNH
jgi:S1-C subfamily serine protease